MAADMVTSTEYLLDKQIQGLLRKLAAGTATAADRAEIARLTKRRSQLMYSPRVEPSWPSSTRRGFVAA